MHEEWKMKIIFDHSAECNGKKKTSRENQEFFEFETKRKIKWQAYWRPIQSVVALLHRIDGILPVVTGYFSQTFVVT